MRFAVGVERKRTEMPKEMHVIIDHARLRALFVAICLGLWAVAVTARGADDKGKAAPAAPRLTATALLVQAAGGEEAQAADARKQLAEMGADGLPTLLDALKSRESPQRDAAIAVLESIVDPRAVKPLAGLLRHADTRVAHAAAWALRRIGVPAAEELAAALAGRDKAAHYPAAYALSGIAAYRKADPWLAALKSDDDRVRYYAVAELGECTDPRGVEALRLDTVGGDAHMRQKVAAALEMVAAARHAAAILAEDPEGVPMEAARYQAAMTAWSDGGPASVDLLIRGLQDRSPRIRAHCATALGSLGTVRGIEPLIKIIEVPVDSQQVSIAVKSLAQITGQAFGFDAKAWRQWYVKALAVQKPEGTEK